MTPVVATVSVQRPSQYTADDCDRAVLLGIVERALLASEEFLTAYGRSTLTVTVDQEWSDGPFSSTEQVPQVDSADRVNEGQTAGAAARY